MKRNKVILLACLLTICIMGFNTTSNSANIRRSWNRACDMLGPYIKDLSRSYDIYNKYCKDISMSDLTQEQQKKHFIMAKKGYELFEKSKRECEKAKSAWSDLMYAVNEDNYQSAKETYESLCESYQKNYMSENNLGKFYGFWFSQQSFWARMQLNKSHKK